LSVSTVAVDVELSWLGSGKSVWGGRVFGGTPVLVGWAVAETVTLVVVVAADEARVSLACDSVDAAVGKPRHVAACPHASSLQPLVASAPMASEASTVRANVGRTNIAMTDT
jgi:hypothetical protein